MSLSCASDLPPAKAPPPPPSADSKQTPPAYLPEAQQSSRIVGGAKCLALLAKLDVNFRKPSTLRGVATPVEITGPIGGILYTVEGRKSLICDCRLALALLWAAPVLQERNVTEIQFSGAYVYRTTRSGRPSRHALGLAIDAHRFRFKDIPQLSVQRDYERGQGSGCGPKAAELNQIACNLRKLQLFRELITPDHNPDHYDHFHLAIAPE